MSEFKIGDKVKFLEIMEDDRIPEYKTDNDGIDVALIIHGSLRWNGENAEVVGISAGYVVVRYSSNGSKFMQLGFSKDSLELVTNTELINKETMKDITEFGKKALSDAKKEIAIERAELEKEQAKKILREIYSKKDVAEAVIKTTTRDLEEIDESLKVFNQK